MQPPTLEYQSPKRSHSSWRPFLLVFVFGPLTGALVGFMQVAAVVMWWLHLGQPDFFYRGWQGAELFCILQTIGGTTVGAAYGFALWKFEKRERRRVRLQIAIPIVVAIGFVVAAANAVLDYRRQEIRSPLVPAAIAFILGLVVSAAASRRLD